MGDPLQRPLDHTLALLGGRWKPLLLWELRAGVLRFGELRRRIGGISQKMLAQRLRELERDGLVSRRVHAVVPPRVDYELTPLGRSLLPILERMDAWARGRSSSDPVQEPPRAGAGRQELPDWVD